MATGKTSTLTIRLESALKDALRVPDRDPLSIANRIEVMIRDHYGRNCIPIQEQRALPLEGVAPDVGGRGGEGCS